MSYLHWERQDGSHRTAIKAFVAGIAVALALLAVGGALLAKYAPDVAAKIGDLAFSPREKQNGSGPAGAGGTAPSPGGFLVPAGPEAAQYETVYAAEKVGPAVVGVINKALVWDFFSGRTRIVQQGAGSGVIFDPQGYIVTNFHVVEGAREIEVILSDGRTLPAQVLGTDKATDLAVLKVAAGGLPSASFGDSDKLKVGEPVIAIGNPVDMEFQRSVTYGVVSGLNRKVQIGERVFRLIQTDAVINPGNSGGPLVNMRGEVVGINTMKLDVPRVEGMGFAIPSNTVRPITQELMSRGKVSRPWLGVGVVDKATAARYGIRVDQGLYVGQVEPDGPAARSGIREGDIITKVDGKTVETFGDLREAIEARRVGETVEVVISRDGRSLTMRVTLAEMPS